MIKGIIRAKPDNGWRGANGEYLDIDPERKGVSGEGAYYGIPSTHRNSRVIAQLEKTTWGGASKLYLNGRISILENMIELVSIKNNKSAVSLLKKEELV